MIQTNPSFAVDVGEGRVIQKVNVDYYKRRFLDIPYANVSPTQKLDIYLPEGEGPFPVILCIHGGAFAFGDSRGPDCVSALHGLKRGYAVVSFEWGSYISCGC